MTDYAMSFARSGKGVAPLMTFDGEWGLSMRIKDTPRFPQNMGLGAIANTDLIYRYGAEMARECKLLGIQVNFAPVLDVNSNPSNPVIGYRSFGEDPSRSDASANYIRADSRTTAYRLSASIFPAMAIPAQTLTRPSRR